MHYNQYILGSSATINGSMNLCTLPFGDFTLYYHPALRVTKAEGGAADVLLLGYIIDPENPLASDSDVVTALAEQCSDKEKLFSRLQVLSGRFVIVYRNSKDLLAIGDPCGARQIYFHRSQVLITSSLELFWEACGTTLEISPDKYSLTTLEEYEESYRAWFGNESLDDRLGKVLPNHYLNLSTRALHRLPVSEELLVRPHEACEYAASVLKGSMQAIRRRCRVVQTLTAGWDTRTLLAAARFHAHETEFFVIAGPDLDERHPDVVIPLRLSRRLDLNLKVFRPGKVSDAFREVCATQRISVQPRRLAEIQVLFNEYSGRNAVRLAGIASAIMKSEGYSSTEITADMLYAFSTYYKRSGYVQEMLDSWIKCARRFCAENSIEILDLFYWEQRLGHWGALYAYEQDVALEEYWPHGHRNLLLSVLRLPVRERTRPDCRFHGELIARLWPEALAEAINPTSSWRSFNSRMRKHALLRYWKIRLKEGLSKR